MHDPDLEGFVRMEGVKGRRYLAIKRDKFTYYNTHNVSHWSQILQMKWRMSADSILLISRGV